MECRYPVNGVVKIKGKLALVRKVNFNSVEILFLEDLISWQNSGFDKGKVPKWIVLCRESREGPGYWSNSQFTSYIKGLKISVPINTPSGQRLSAIAGVHKKSILF